MARAESQEAVLRWDKDKAPSCFCLLAKLNIQLLKVWQSLLLSGWPSPHSCQHVAYNRASAEVRRLC